MYRDNKHKQQVQTVTFVGLFAIAFVMGLIMSIPLKG